MTGVIVKYLTLNPGAIPEKKDFGIMYWVLIRVWLQV